MCIHYTFTNEYIINTNLLIDDDDELHVSLGMIISFFIFYFFCKHLIWAISQLKLSHCRILCFIIWFNIDTIINIWVQDSDASNSTMILLTLTLFIWRSQIVTLLENSEYIISIYKYLWIYEKHTKEPALVPLRSTYFPCYTKKKIIEEAYPTSRSNTAIKELKWNLASVYEN